MSFVVIGVHPFEAPEPCHIFEIEMIDEDSFDWDNVTQVLEGEPRDEWQCAWDERSIGEGRWTFFFHHLDVEKPLLVEDQSIAFPEPTPIPVHLTRIDYSPPC